MMAVSVRRVGGDDYGFYLKIFIAGQSGAGKTRFASTFPDPYYLATDPSLDSVLDRQPAYSIIDSSDDLREILVKLRQPSDILLEKAFGFAPRTVVIDTADDLQRILIKERLAETKRDTLAIADYGWLGDQMRDLIRNFRNLNMHVVVTCHTKQDRDEESGRVYVQPGLVGQFADQISAMFSLSFLIRTTQLTRVVDGQSKRVEVKIVQTSADSQHLWVKDRFGVLPRPEYESDLTSDFERINRAVFDRELAPGRTLSEDAVGAQEAPKASSVDEGARAAQGRKKATTASRAGRSTVTLPDLSVLTPETVPQGDVLDDSSNGQQELNGSEGALEPAEALDEPAAEPENGSTPVAQRVPDPGTPSPASDVPADMVCEGCSNKIEHEDQRDLSQLRFHRRLCRACFHEAKAAATRR